MNSKTAVTDYNIYVCNLSNKDSFKEVSYGLSRKQKRSFVADKTIDLHGFNQSQAFTQLLNFFIQCQNENVKKVLVITGGSDNRHSVLREAFEVWVRQELSGFVSSYCHASSQCGGDGAFFVILKSYTPKNLFNL